MEKIYSDLDVFILITDAIYLKTKFEFDIRLRIPNTFLYNIDNILSSVGEGEINYYSILFYLNYASGDAAEYLSQAPVFVRQGRLRRLVSIFGNSG